MVQTLPRWFWYSPKSEKPEVSPQFRRRFQSGKILMVKLKMFWHSLPQIFLGPELQHEVPLGIIPFAFLIVGVFLHMVHWLLNYPIIVFWDHLQLSPTLSYIRYSVPFWDTTGCWFNSSTSCLEGPRKEHYCHMEYGLVY